MKTQIIPGALRTPRAAAFAGVAFAVLYGLTVAMFRLVVPANPSDAGAWLTNSGQRTEVAVALSLVPFCGIFFMWFMAAVRSQMGDAEDRFFATVFLGSGLLFVAMLFVFAATFGGLVSLAEMHGGKPPLGVWQLGRATTYAIGSTYAMRMAAIFTLVTSTIAFRLRLHHRAIAWVGYVVALFLLFGGAAIPWLQLAFPVWVLLVSINILLRAFRSPAV